MRSSSFASLAFVLAVLVGACASTNGPTLIGWRQDGLEVVCAEGDAGQFGCDPQSPDESGADQPDGCSSWAEGGPALVLWPPNHHLVEVGIAQCLAARPDCSIEQAALQGGRVVAVTSDEPLEVGAGGDGNTPEGDLGFSPAGTVLLRAERQGGADGRVYRLEIEDQAGARDSCEVHVPHDQGPAPGAVDSGEQVRVPAA